LASISQLSGGHEQFFITEPHGNNRNRMEIIGLISLVRVVQSFLTRLVLTILHNISMGFMSVEFPGQSRTL